MIFSALFIVFVGVGLSLMVIDVQCQNEINKIKEYESKRID